MSGIPTAAFPTEELLHGRLHGLTPESIAFVIADGEDEIAGGGRARAAWPSRLPGADRRSSGAHWPGGVRCAERRGTRSASMLPFQWLAVLLAEARGLDPAAMRHGSLARELAIKTDRRTMSDRQAVAVGIDVGGTTIKMGLVGRDGACSRADASPTRRCRLSRRWSTRSPPRPERWRRDRRPAGLRRRRGTGPCAGRRRPDGGRHRQRAAAAATDRSRRRCASGSAWPSRR